MANWLANFIDKDAILIDVRAAEICCRTSSITSDSTLELDFNYLRHSNHVMRITLYDTNPPRIKDIRADTNESYGLSGIKPLTAGLTNQTRDIRISPRDAMRTAFTSPSAPALPANGLNGIDATIYLQHAIYGTGLTRNWYISYYTDAELNSPGSFVAYDGKPTRRITFLFDPIDGHLVEFRDH